MEFKHINLTDISFIYRLHSSCIMSMLHITRRDVILNTRSLLWCDKSISFAVGGYTFEQPT